MRKGLSCFDKSKPRPDAKDSMRISGNTSIISLFKASQPHSRWSILRAHLLMPAARIRIARLPSGRSSGRAGFR